MAYPVSPRILVIIPTYNERENIEQLLSVLLSIHQTLEILVVDDASPDGTDDLVAQLAEREPRVHLLCRPQKLGLGSAYVEGFRFALGRSYTYIFEMDADFSHDPHDIPRFLDAIEGADLVLGSRYVHGITVVDWPLSRLLLSYFGNLYARLITGMPIRDTTGGFKCFRRQVLEVLDLDRVSSEGYSFQIEITFKVWKKGFRVVEIPILFRDRTRGKSKMSFKINREAVWTVWKLKILSWLGKI
jgi:dolichol-phosphate mannosyltransferase